MTNNATTLSIQDHVATITMDRPDKHNAFDDIVIAELLAHFAVIRQDTSVRVAILRAEGRHFCAGADLAWMKRMAQLNYDENQCDARQLARLMSELNALPVPTVVRVQGAAYGGAIGLIACSDIAIASNNARFCLSEVKLGLAPATIGPFVVDAMGARRCRQLFVTGEVFNAEQAAQYGLIHQRVPLEELDEALDITLKKIVKAGPQATQAAKQLIQHIQTGDDDISAFTSEMIARLRVSAEGQEGLSAFFEKRSPNWQTES